MRDNISLRAILVLSVTVAVLALTTGPAGADLVHSFDIGGSTATGDLPTDDTGNPNGLQITGQVGDWASISTGTPFATDDGVRLTFTPPDWGGTVGDSRGVNFGRAIRIGSFLANEADVPWTLSGLTPNVFYDMIWYNKRTTPGENRAPNTGVTGFDAGNGIGASAPLDADKDQNFIGVQADENGMIFGTWFLLGGLDDITAVTGVQVALNPDPPTLLGDADGDGVVNAADYIALKTHIGTTSGAALADGDFDESGTVDWDDLQLLEANYGETGASSPVPEPATLFVMLAAGLPALLRRRQRRS